MPENSARRSVLKKMAATSVVGGGLLGSSTTAAAASDASYEIEVGFKSSNDGSGDYRLFVPYGEDADWAIFGDGTEDTDQLYSNDDRGGVEITGNLSTSDSDTVDGWIIDSMSPNYQIDYKDDDVYVEDTL